MKRSNSVRKVWMRSFLLVITILLIILTAFFFYMKYMIQQNELERNASENQFLKTILDEKFMGVTNLAADIMYRPAQLFPQMEGDDVSFEKSEVFRLVTELESHCSSNNIIEDIFIYYPDEEFIIGANGPRRPQTYYYFYNNHSQKGYENWRQNLLNRDTRGFFLYGTEDGQRDLLYSGHLELESGLNCDIYFKLSQQGITKILKEANINNINQFFAIMDYQNQIYAYSGDSSLLPYAVGADNSGTFAAKPVENYIASNLSSYVSSIYYLTVSNKSTVLRLSGNMTEILMICLLLSTVLSIAAAFYLSGRNLKPVRQLMTKLSVDDQIVKENEYDVIGQNLDRLMNNYNLAVLQVEQQQQLLTSSFLSLVLNGEQRDSNTISFLAGIYGIEFPYSCFCAAVIDFPDTSVRNGWERFPTEENLLQAYHGIVEGRLVTVLNFDKEEGYDIEAVSGFMESVNQQLDSDGLRHRITVGGVYQTLSGICYSYSEAIYVLDTSQEKLLYYKDSKYKIGEKDNSASYYEFQKYLMERNYIEAEQILPLLFKQYLTNANPVVYQYRKSAVLRTVYDAVWHESIRPEAARLMENRNMELLFTKGTPAQVQENIRLVLEQLASIITDAPENDQSLAGRAKNLIDNTWSDPMLGLASIAEKLNVSSSHLSRVFKKETGMGIVEYISRIRIDASKKLIAAGELNIKSIALTVGFSSDVNFIRVFKKYENITPGKYETPSKDNLTSK